MPVPLRIFLDDVGMWLENLVPDPQAWTRCVTETELEVKGLQI